MNITINYNWNVKKINKLLANEGEAEITIH